MKKRVLVTGIHRSGTTWLASALNAGGRFRMVGEPFNPVNAQHYGLPLPQAYYHVPSPQETFYAGKLAHIAGDNYRLRDAIDRFKMAPHLWARIAILKNFVLHSTKFRKQDVLFKDPIAFFNANFFSRQGFKIIVTIRHPAAFVGSLLKMNWTHLDARILSSQPELTARYGLGRYAEEIEIRSKTGDFISKASLFWKILYDVCLQYRNQNPDWHFCKHEDISIHPETELEAICAYLGIDFDASMREFVTRTTSPSNPIDNVSRGHHQLYRNSRANVKLWKQRLTSDQITYLYEDTYQIASAFYQDSDW